MKNEDRTEQNKKDSSLESVIRILNTVLKDDEVQLTREFNKPNHPSFFIVGVARSGSTLIYQWLASSGLFAYPSNIISRFYEAPYIGALVHKMFVDYDKLGEILGGEKIKFESNLGKTFSAVSPNEFWYFWRRFFDSDKIQKGLELKLTDDESNLFLRELTALESAFDKPLLMKAMILNWNLEYLEKLLPNAVFIHIKRDPLMNMHSLYNARIKYFGEIEKWYSFKPPEYEYLKDKDIYEQLAGQVVLTNSAIENKFKSSKNYVSIGYKEFCNDTSLLLRRIEKILDTMDYKLEESSTLVSDFKLSDKILNKDFDQKKARKALNIIGDFSRQ